ncbi:MAG: 5'-3' exonuclease H3TH domain-containing protein [Gammaproteobacteria bacterium]|nr:5'-3' exonuclease H3TH domain-containing protein [Gammaproteobacteria bacterium]
MKALYLIDASIYIFRGWHCYPYSRQDSEGRPLNALHGFADFLLDLLEKEYVEYLVCAFDQKKSRCVRRALFADYKANRSPVPEELRYQFGLCRELVAALGMVSFTSNQYEADDLIATLATRLRGSECRSIILTADKDLTQLVGVQDEWWDYARKVRLSRSGVKKKYRLEPEQIADMLALMGDKVDNIPGIPNVGQATAVRLLIKWKDIDGIYANLTKVHKMQFRGAAHVQELLMEHEDQVRLSRKLTGLFMDESLPSDPEALRLQPVDKKALRQTFDRLLMKPEQQQRWWRVLGL